MKTAALKSSESCWTQAGRAVDCSRKDGEFPQSVIGFDRTDRITRQDDMRIFGLLDDNCLYNTYLIYRIKHECLSHCFDVGAGGNTFDK